jgi:hypothetical protein
MQLYIENFDYGFLFSSSVCVDALLVVAAD